MADSPSPIRLLFVDDSEDVTTALERFFRTESSFECAGSLQSAADLSAAVKRLEVDIVLLDMTMPGKEPLEAVRELSAEVPGCRVIMYTGHTDQETIDAAFDAGAWGVIPKQTDTAVMTEAIRQVMAGHVVAVDHPGQRR